MYQNTGFWFVVFLCLFQSGWNVEYYESVQWTPQNPNFRFSNETIQDGKAYYRLSVQPNAKMSIICPHSSTYLHESQAIPNEQRYETVWYVDKQSFLECKVGDRVGHINNIWLPCDTPDKLTFDTLVFQRFSLDNLVFPPGSEHYFIATSDGTQASLNSTSGGHCDDVANGVSMKMIIYVCTNETDRECNEITAESSTVTTASITESTAKLGPVTQAARKSDSWDVWHLLTIIFGVGFAVSLVIISVCLFFVCHRRKKKKLSCDKDRLHPGTDENGVENIQVNPMISRRV
ncbi:hypothetical protein ACROYT_G016855 [Oculina patagonica]